MVGCAEKGLGERKLVPQGRRSGRSKQCQEPLAGASRVSATKTPFVGGGEQTEVVGEKTEVVGEQTEVEDECTEVKDVCKGV